MAAGRSVTKKGASSADKTPFGTTGYVAAEGEGFEPPVRIAHNGFRDRPIQPLWHPSVFGAPLYYTCIPVVRNGCSAKIGGN